METKDIKPVDGEYICPECAGNGVKKAFKALKYLGRHRMIHGINGTSRTVQQKKALTGANHNASKQEDLERHIAFCAGFTFAELKHYATAHEVSFSSITNGVAKLLLAASRG